MDLRVRAPMMASVIARRLLVNYRLDPGAAARILPRGMRPDLANGYAVGGICLIRLTRLRPAGLPAALGVTTENAAHRIGVVWDGPRGEQRGVYIPRRDTSSRLTALVGGRVFPGEHHRARFEVREAADRLGIEFTGADSAVRVEVGVGIRRTAFSSALFDDVSAASDYFRDAPIGRSARESGDELDSVRLTTHHWALEPTVLLSAESSFFADPARFPAGTAEPDSALLMRGIPALWAPEPA